MLLGGLVLGRDDDCGGGEFLRRGGGLVVEAEGGHEFDEGGQGGHRGRGWGRGALGDLGKGGRG